MEKIVDLWLYLLRKGLRISIRQLKTSKNSTGKFSPSEKFLNNPVNYYSATALARMFGVKLRSILLMRRTVILWG